MEEVRIEVEGVTKVGESTVLVASVHADGTTKLIDVGIIGVEGVDENVEVGKGVVILLHLAEGEGALLVGGSIGGIGGDGLCGLGNEFEWSHII